MFKRKVYVITAFVWEKEHQYPLPLERMVFSKYSKAYAEVERIVEGIFQEADEMGWIVNAAWKDEFKTFEVEYANGTIDNYIILEREVI